MQSPITNSLFSTTGYNLHSISLVPVVPCLAVHAPGEERPVICFYQQLSQLECEMSNQIAERTIKSYVIDMRMAASKFIPRLANFENSVHLRSVLLRTWLQETYLQIRSSSLGVSVTEGCR